MRSPLAATSPEALGYSHYFAELIDEWAAEADADERLFGSGARARGAGRWVPVEALARYFECWLLRLQGVYPADLAHRRRAARSAFLDGGRGGRRRAEVGGAWRRVDGVLRELELVHRTLIAHRIWRRSRDRFG